MPGAPPLPVVFGAWAFRVVAPRTAERHPYATGPVSDAIGFGALLIRPDGIIAWTDGRNPDPESFQHAAAHWFGDPTL